MAMDERLCEYVIRSTLGIIREELLRKHKAPPKTVEELRRLMGRGGTCGPPAGSPVMLWDSSGVVVYEGLSTEETLRVFRYLEKGRMSDAAPGAEECEIGEPALRLSWEDVLARGGVRGFKLTEGEESNEDQG